MIHFNLKKFSKNNKSRKLLFFLLLVIIKSNEITKLKPLVRLCRKIINNFSIILTCDFVELMDLINGNIADNIDVDVLISEKLQIQANERISVTPDLLKSKYWKKKISEHSFLNFTVFKFNFKNYTTLIVLDIVVTTVDADFNEVFSEPL